MLLSAVTEEPPRCKKLLSFQPLAPSSSHQSSSFDNISASSSAAWLPRKRGRPKKKKRTQVNPPLYNEGSHSELAPVSSSETVTSCEDGKDRSATKTTPQRSNETPTDKTALQSSDSVSPPMLTPLSKSHQYFTSFDLEADEPGSELGPPKLTSECVDLAGSGDDLSKCYQGPAGNTDEGVFDGSADDPASWSLFHLEEHETTEVAAQQSEPEINDRESEDKGPVEYGEERCVVESLDEPEPQRKPSTSDETRVMLKLCDLKKTMSKALSCAPPRSESERSAKAGPSHCSKAAAGPGSLAAAKTSLKPKSEEPKAKSGLAGAKAAVEQQKEKVVLAPEAKQSRIPSRIPEAKKSHAKSKPVPDGTAKDHSTRRRVRSIEGSMEQVSRSFSKKTESFQVALAAPQGLGAKTKTSLRPAEEPKTKSDSARARAAADQKPKNSLDKSTSVSDPTAMDHSTKTTRVPGIESSKEQEFKTLTKKAESSQPMKKSAGQITKQKTSFSSALAGEVGFTKENRLSHTKVTAEPAKQKKVVAISRSQTSVDGIQSPCPEISGTVPTQSSATKQHTDLSSGRDLPDPKTKVIPLDREQLQHAKIAAPLVQDVQTRPSSEFRPGYRIPRLSNRGTGKPAEKRSMVAPEVLCREAAQFEVRKHRHHKSVHSSHHPVKLQSTEVSSASKRTKAPCKIPLHRVSRDSDDRWKQQRAAASPRGKPETVLPPLKFKPKPISLQQYRDRRSQDPGEPAGSAEEPVPSAARTRESVRGLGSSLAEQLILSYAKHPQPSQEPMITEEDIGLDILSDEPWVMKRSNSEDSNVFEGLLGILGELPKDSDVLEALLGLEGELPEATSESEPQRPKSKEMRDSPASPTPFAWYVNYQMSTEETIVSNSSLPVKSSSTDVCGDPEATAGSALGPSEGRSEDVAEDRDVEDGGSMAVDVPDDSMVGIDARSKDPDGVGQGISGTSCRDADNLNQPSSGSAEDKSTDFRQDAGSVVVDLPDDSMTGTATRSEDPSGVERGIPGASCRAAEDIKQPSSGSAEDKSADLAQLSIGSASPRSEDQANVEPEHTVAEFDEQPGPSIATSSDQQQMTSSMLLEAAQSGSDAPLFSFG